MRSPFSLPPLLPANARTLPRQRLLLLQGERVCEREREKGDRGASIFEVKSYIFTLQQILEEIIITKDAVSPWSTLSPSIPSLRPLSRYHLYLDSENLEKEILSLFSFKCPLSSCSSLSPLGSLSSLKSHLNREHNMFYWCVSCPVSFTLI